MGGVPLTINAYEEIINIRKPMKRIRPSPLTVETIMIKNTQKTMGDIMYLMMLRLTLRVMLSPLTETLLLMFSVIDICVMVINNTIKDRTTIMSYHRLSL